MLRIVGDCNFADGYFDVGFGVGSSIENKVNPFSRIKEEDSNDFWIGNFECVCSDVSNKRGLESRQFIISPTVCDNINHLNLYGVSNNHVMQHGAEAFSQMLKYISTKNVLYAGTEDKPTTVFEHQGRRVALTAFNQRPENYTKPPLYWAMPEYGDVKSELDVYKGCDYRIVFVHWGIEFINYPYVDQKQFAHYLVECGADLVIGMHPHVMQGYEVYKGKYIFYSLGNCVFNMPWEPTKFSLQVNVDLTSMEVTYRYLHVGDDFFPEYIEKVPSKYTTEYLNELLDIYQDNESYFAKASYYLHQFRKANRKDILKKFWKLRCSDIISMLIGFIRRRLA